ncbi:MAG: HAMP domain-containing histidine kinase [Lachnospiraceae bacterium]|nr:HAMP domain-containing histidine kinase [Lachnospiraceae bacterium]
MKIKYLAAAFTLFMGMIMAYFWLETAGDGQRVLDMVYYNKELKTISRAADTGMERTDLETEYDCSLLFLTDGDYKSRLNEAISSDNVILDYEKNGVIVGKVVWDRENRLQNRWKVQMRKTSMAVCIAVLLGGWLLLAVVWYCFIRPFSTLKTFAAEVAKGNLDFPLPMEKGNFFGAFTESFDIMREELRRARENEYLANVSKKELVAELSHDIKTPVSAIKAVCEVLEIKEKNEDTLEKVGIIAAKAETIEHLADNMFHATLEELEVLKVEPKEESSTLIPDMFQDLKYYGEILLENEIGECLVWMDRLRMEQVIDNIVNNSFKYAKTPVSVRFEDKRDGIGITIKDKGKGVSEDELPLVTEKFFRGSNAKGESGSGLGMYLVKRFMEQMYGEVECFFEDGFGVTLFLKKV